MILRIFAVVFVAFAATGSAFVISAGPAGCNFTTIVAALNAAEPGDTIEVLPGIYNEHIVVRKSVTIRGLHGPTDTVIDAKGDGCPVSIEADGVVFEGFQVVNSGVMSRDAGIKVSSSGCNLSGNNAISNNVGIYLLDSTNCTIMQNVLTGNRRDGIALERSHGNYLRNNTAVDGGKSGIDLFGSSNNTLEQNRLLSCMLAGIKLSSSSDSNTLRGNEALYSHSGLTIVSSGGNRLIDNNVSNNDMGIALEGCSLNLAANNYLSGNEIGINVKQSIRQTIRDNRIMQSEDYGVYLDHSNDSIVLGNHVNESGDDGIGLMFSFRNLVSGNNASANSFDGIRLYYSQDNSILNNTATSNGSFGINLDETSINNRIQGNVLNGNARGPAGDQSGKNLWDDESQVMRISEHPG